MNNEPELSSTLERSIHANNTADSHKQQGYGYKVVTFIERGRNMEGFIYLDTHNIVPFENNTCYGLPIKKIKIKIKIVQQ